MTTYVGSTEAARLLGVTKPTLYAYVSRGLVERRTAVDGRTSRSLTTDSSSRRRSLNRWTADRTESLMSDVHARDNERHIAWSASVGGAT